MKNIAFYILVSSSLCIVCCNNKESFPPELDILSPVENEVFKVDSFYSDGFWDYRGAHIQANIQDSDGLIQVSVQVWGGQKEYFNKVYHLTGEPTFQVHEYWRYEKTTGSFEVRFRIEDTSGDEILAIRQISVIE